MGEGGDGTSPKTLKGVGSDISILKGWDAQKGGIIYKRGGWTVSLTYF